MKTKSPDQSGLLYFHYHYFISHSKKDRMFADALSKHLLRRSRRCWIDRISISRSSHYQSDITDAIKHCRQMIVLLSEHSLKSRWVKFETGTVLRKDPINEERHLIPVKLEAIDLDERFAGLQMIDATGGIDLAVIEEIIQSTRLDEGEPEAIA